jgi:hypothetical protein
MNDVIKEALLIDANGLKTTCTVIENLPKTLVYHKAKKLMPKEEYSEQLVPAFVYDENGKRVPTGEMVDELHPGIVMDGAGSGAFVFERGSDDSRERMKAIVEHVNDTVKDPDLRIKWVPYAAQPGNKNSNPRSISSIPRVHLLEPVISPSATLPVAAPVEVRPTFKKERKPMSEEHKAKLRAALAAAREAKKVKGA